MVALGAIVRPQVPPEQLRNVAVAADEAGLEQLWLWQDCFFESGIASAAAALAWTRRLRVGIGVLPADAAAGRGGRGRNRPRRGQLAGRAAADRTDHHEVVAYLTAATGPDGPDRMRAELESQGRAANPELGVAGDAETVAKAVLRLANAGAGTVALVPTADEPDPAGFVRFVARQVRPLVP